MEDLSCGYTVYVARPYPDTFWTCYESVIVPDKYFSSNVWTLVGANMALLYTAVEYLHFITCLCLFVSRIPSSLRILLLALLCAGRSHNKQWFSISIAPATNGCYNFGTTSSQVRSISVSEPVQMNRASLLVWAHAWARQHFALLGRSYEHS